GAAHVIGPLARLLEGHLGEPANGEVAVDALLVSVEDAPAQVSGLGCGAKVKPGGSRIPKAGGFGDGLGRTLTAKLVNHGCVERDAADLRHGGLLTVVSTESVRPDKPPATTASPKQTKRAGFAFIHAAFRVLCSFLVCGGLCRFGS